MKKKCNCGGAKKRVGRPRKVVVMNGGFLPFGGSFGNMPLMKAYEALQGMNPLRKAGLF